MCFLNKIQDPIFKIYLHDILKAHEDFMKHKYIQ